MAINRPICSHWLTGSICLIILYLFGFLSPNPRLFLFILLLLNNNFTEKSEDFSGIRTRIVGKKVSMMTTWPPPRPNTLFCLCYKLHLGTSQLLSCLLATCSQWKGPRICLRICGRQSLDSPPMLNAGMSCPFSFASKTSEDEVSLDMIL